MLPFRPTRTAAILGLCFALGPICAGFFVYKGLQTFRAADRYISVKGLVERMEKADRGTLDLQFKVSGNDLPELYKELDSATQLTTAFLKQEGFDNKEIALGAPRFKDKSAEGYYRPEEGMRYTIDQSIIVNSLKVDTLQALPSKTATLITQGVPLMSSTLNFYLDKFNDLRPQLIIEATKNAQKMGESIAKTTGQKLGGIRYVNQGVISILNPNTNPEQSWSDTNSLMKKIRVLATVDFYID